jgi:hypothetical protein
MVSTMASSSFLVGITTVTWTGNGASMGICPKWTYF